MIVRVSFSSPSGYYIWLGDNYGTGIGIWLCSDGVERNMRELFPYAEDRNKCIASYYHEHFRRAVQLVYENYEVLREIPDPLPYMNEKHTKVFLVRDE